MLVFGEIDMQSQQYYLLVLLVFYLTRLLLIYAKSIYNEKILMSILSVEVALTASNKSCD